MPLSEAYSVSRSSYGAHMSALRDAGFLKEKIDGANACESYHGIATALTTYNGTAVVIMARNHRELMQACREICHPDQKLDSNRFIPANIIHDAYIIREDV